MTVTIRTALNSQQNPRSTACGSRVVTCRMTSTNRSAAPFHPWCFQYKIHANASARTHLPDDSLQCPGGVRDVVQDAE